MYQDLTSRLNDSNECPTVEDFLRQNGINLDDFHQKGWHRRYGDGSLGRRAYSRIRLLPTGNHPLHQVDIVETAAIFYDSTCETTIVDCDDDDDDVQRYPIHVNYIVVLVTILLLIMLGPLFISGPYGVLKSEKNSLSE
jgi:hypothetical protein